MKKLHSEIPLEVHKYKQHIIELHNHIQAYHGLPLGADPKHFRGFIIYAPDSDRIVKTTFGIFAGPGWEENLLKLAKENIEYRIDIGL